MIVDDNKDGAFPLFMLLEASGYEVLVGCFSTWQSPKVKIKESRIKNSSSRSNLFASPQGTTGVGGQPLPSGPRIGNEWGKKAGDSRAGLVLREIVYPPTSPPHREGDLWGIAAVSAGAASLVAYLGRLKINSPYLREVENVPKITDAGNYL